MKERLVTLASSILPGQEFRLAHFVFNMPNMVLWETIHDEVQKE